MNNEFETAVRAMRVVASDAGDRFGDFASAHECLGVLQEEFREFEDAVRLRQDNPDRARRLYLEAIDVAAVALRFAAQAVSTVYGIAPSSSSVRRRPA